MTVWLRLCFLEPIQDLPYSRTTDASIEKWLSALSVQLSRMAAELNVGIVTIAHENDEGQIRDCRTIGKRASVVVKLERDKMTEDERLRRIRRLMLNRYGREDTILTGAKDPMNRRRYASAL